MPRKQRQDQEPSPAGTAESKRITPVDIQEKEFRLAFRGYHESEVDQFLDELTEELARLYAENKRLREELDFKRTERLDAPGSGGSDALLRQAREEAARILDDARARASTMGPPGGLLPGLRAGTALLGPFLAREREFLQALASLIQGHADAVKEGIQRAREEMTAAERGEHSTPIEPGATVAAAVPVSPLQEQEEPTAEVSDAEPLESESAGEEREPWSEPDQGREAWRSGDRIMDLTDDGVEVDERQTPERVAADDHDDRSIREFFWGED
jgi:DivIVA domain-containing protein